jgi:ElaB/YqjD/DUF883 family membrane-anchored ribosome-binding protein
MGQNAEELSTTPADIEQTRSNLSRDIDELSDKVSPQRVIERRKEAARSRMGSLRDKVMGTASEAKHSVASTGGDVGGSVTGSAENAVSTIGSKAQGNPLAAGAIAFGAGMLLSALLPASDKETQLAQRAMETAKEQGQPVLEDARSVGKEMGQNLKESATDSAAELRTTAQESAQNLKQEGQSSAQTVKDEATP